MGAGEGRTPVLPEAPLGYHSFVAGVLTVVRHPHQGQCQVGSLTGAVASEKVTEALKGILRMDGNHSESVKAEGCLTARLTNRAERKLGLSDPAV